MLMTAFALCAAVLTLLTRWWSTSGLWPSCSSTAAAPPPARRRRRAEPVSAAHSRPQRGGGHRRHTIRQVDYPASWLHRRRRGRSVRRAAPPPARAHGVTVSSGAAAWARGRRSRGRSTRSTARACPTTRSSADRRRHRGGCRVSRGVRRGPPIRPRCGAGLQLPVEPMGLAVHADHFRHERPAQRASTPERRIRSAGDAERVRPVVQPQNHRAVRLDRLFGGRRLGVLGLAVVERRNDRLQPARARVLARESQGLQEASGSAATAVAGTSAAALLKAGVRRRRVRSVGLGVDHQRAYLFGAGDAGLFCLAGNLLLSRDQAWSSLAVWPARSRRCWRLTSRPGWR